MENLNYIYPEIFLFVGICFTNDRSILKNSYKLVNKLAIVLLVLLATYVLRSGLSNQGIFLESYISDNLSFFIKILIIISTLIILISSQQFIQDVKISKFEYPIILLLSVLGMFFMISSNDLILFYLGLELQSLSLYVLASIDKENIKSTESGIKYFVLSALSSGLLLYGCSLLYGFAQPILK